MFIKVRDSSHVTVKYKTAFLLKKFTFISFSTLTYITASLCYYKEIWICQKQFLRFQLPHLSLAPEEAKIDKSLWFTTPDKSEMSNSDPRQQKVMINLFHECEFCSPVGAVRWADKAQCHINCCSSLTNPNSKSDVWHSALLIVFKTCCFG